MGNHDAAVVGGAPPSMRDEPRQAIDWTRGQLDASQLAMLASLPLTREAGATLYVHANAWAPEAWEYVADRSDAARSMLATRQHLSFCGHMHEPRLYHLSATGKTGEFVPAPGVP